MAFPPGVNAAISAWHHWPPKFRQQGLGRAQRLGKAGERFDLSLVVGGLDHVVGDHQQAVGRHQGLGVVGLFEAAAGHRHDARVRVGQIDLVLRPGPGHRPLGWRPPGLRPVFSASSARASSFASYSARSRSRRSRARASITALASGDAGQTILAPGQPRAPTSRRAHPPHRPPPPTPSTPPPRPSTGLRARRRVSTTARCAGSRWRAPWCRPAPPAELQHPGWASSSTSTNSPSIRSSKRRRNAAMVSWSG